MAALTFCCIKTSLSPLQKVDCQKTGVAPSENPMCKTLKTLARKVKMQQKVHFYSLLHAVNETLRPQQTPLVEHSRSMKQRARWSFLFGHQQWLVLGCPPNERGGGENGVTLALGQFPFPSPPISLPFSSVDLWSIRPLPSSFSQTLPLAPRGKTGRSRRIEGEGDGGGEKEDTGRRRRVKRGNCLRAPPSPALLMYLARPRPPPPPPPPLPMPSRAGGRLLGWTQPK